MAPDVASTQLPEKGTGGMTHHESTTNGQEDLEPLEQQDLLARARHVRALQGMQWSHDFMELLEVGVPVNLPEVRNNLEILRASSNSKCIECHRATSFRKK